MSILRDRPEEVAAVRSFGIRALKQNASEVVAHVKAGESVEITEHGRPVAVLSPIRENRYQELTESGVIAPPKSTDNEFEQYIHEHRARLRSQGLPAGNASGQSMSEILEEQRAERE